MHLVSWEETEGLINAALAKNKKNFFLKTAQEPNIVTQVREDFNTDTEIVK